MTKHQAPEPTDLRSLLLRHGMTQRQLAKHLGTGETQVSNWVRGHRPNKENRKRIARVLGTTPEAIWGES